MNDLNTKNLDELFVIGGKDLVFELIHLFIDESVQTIRKLQQATANNQQEVIGQIAHKLKSSSGSLGLSDLAMQCLAIDTKHRSGEQIMSLDVEMLIQLIQKDCEQLLSYKNQKNLS